MASIAFGNPEYLWFLLALPLLIVTHFFLLRYAKRKAMKFANFSALKRATGERYITKNYTVLALRILIILCAVLAVAQTTVWYEGTINQNEYVIALDTSASMSTEDVPPSRLEAAKRYAAEFAQALPGSTQVGLVSFSGVTFIEQPLTTDRGDFLEGLERMEISASGTDIPGAIITSTNLLLTAERGRAIILISDGSNTIETFQSDSLRRASGYAAANRVKIYTIGVGTELDAPIGYLPTYYNVSSTYNQDNLIFIANATGGRHYPAADEESLALAYADIKAANQTSTLSLDLSGGLMLLTLALILLEWGLISTRFRLLP